MSSRLACLPRMYDNTEAVMINRFIRAIAHADSLISAPIIPGRPRTSVPGTSVWTRSLRLNILPLGY